MSYETINVRFQGTVCFIQFNRPDDNNTINSRLIEECSEVLALCEQSVNIVVFSGLPQVFCLGVDFKEMQSGMEGKEKNTGNPEPLYDLWMKLAAGPYITISHVRGKANAGGIGFIAASDIVLADISSQFSLSELLFGLLPACVMPFLTRRIGFQRAQYMTLLTQPFSAREAYEWGLTDACDEKSEDLLRRHLLRLKHLSKTGITRYKRFMNGLDASLTVKKALALETNREIFSDEHNMERIFRYVETGQFPWEK